VSARYLQEIPMAGERAPSPQVLSLRNSGSPIGPAFLVPHDDDRSLPGQHRAIDTVRCQPLLHPPDSPQRRLRTLTANDSRHDFDRVDGIDVITCESDFSHVTSAARSRSFSKTPLKTRAELSGLRRLARVSRRFAAIPKCIHADDQENMVVRRFRRAIGPCSTWHIDSAAFR